MSNAHTHATIEGSPEMEPSPHLIHTLPILVLFPHNRCNCRCVMCDIWKIQQVREITPRDLEAQLASLRELGVRWVVFSGGEPQLNRELATLSEMLRAEGVRVSLLTAGLLLERHARSVANMVDDLTVSLDGPPDVHDLIRCVPGAFDRLARGLEAVRRLRPDMKVSGRCTVQRSNFDRLRDTVDAAKSLHLDSLSFLAVDLTSEAFNRPGSWQTGRQDAVGLGIEGVAQLEREIEALIRYCAQEILTGYIAESAEKLRRITHHFRAHLGVIPATAPRCNAPWVSSVIEADGTVRPCFFHPAYGNIHERPLGEILNRRDALAFRQQLDVASNPVCRNCVCSLYLPPEKVEGIAASVSPSLQSLEPR